MAQKTKVNGENRELNTGEQQDLKTQEEMAQLTFEQALKRLEEVVGKLEESEVPLEEAIELFQEGMRLSKICGEKLDKVEQKIEILIEEEGKVSTRPFDIGEGAE